MEQNKIQNKSMTKEEIHASLDKMLENPKAKTFLNHLVRAYMPVTNIHQVETKPTGDFKCVLTKQPLTSLTEIFQILESNDETIKTKFHKSIMASFDKNSKGEVINPYKEILGDKAIGVTGKETTTCMSALAAQAFYDWVITKSLHGNKHINWLLGSIRRESFIERAENIKDPVVQEKINKLKQQKEDRVATFTLGDSSDVLSKLKAKFESDNN